MRDITEAGAIVGTVFVSADSLKPTNHAVEQSYYLANASIPFGPQTLIDSTGDGQQVSMLSAGNTATVFTIGTALYRLLNRQQTFGTVMMKSTDSGATWANMDAANAPLFETCAGCYDAASGLVYCVYVNANGSGAALRLINFDTSTDTWSAVYGVTGAPVSAQTASLGIWKRAHTLLVLYQSRNTFNALDPSGLGAASYHITTVTVGTWTAPFDAGAGIVALTGWDPTQTLVHVSLARSVMDSTDRVHIVFSTTSVQTVPVIWSNRVFYQAIESNNTLGSFFDFPGQIQPLPAAPYNRQQLEAYSGAPYGAPVVYGDSLLLPVAMRNDSLLDRFPIQVPNLYVGTGLSAPAWALNASGTIDPDVLLDDTIWIQQAPSLTFDGANFWAVYPAQDPDGQNLARLRLATSSNLVAPTAGWSAQTIFDLQVDAAPGFNFSTQILSGAGAFTAAAAVLLPAVSYVNVAQLALVILPDPARDC